MTTPWPDEAALPPLRPVIDVPLPEETEMSDERPTWTFKHPGLSAPATLRVEPAFLDRLGLVFVGIGEWGGEHWTGPHNGTWLNRAQLDEFITQLRAAAAYAETHPEDDDE